MQTCEVGPGQQYARQARKALEEIKYPAEIRQYPAHWHPGQRDGGWMENSRQKN